METCWRTLVHAHHVSRRCASAQIRCVRWHNGAALVDVMGANKPYRRMVSSLRRDVRVAVRRRRHRQCLPVHARNDFCGNANVGFAGPSAAYSCPAILYVPLLLGSLRLCVAFGWLVFIPAVCNASGIAYSTLTHTCYVACCLLPPIAEYKGSCPLHLFLRFFLRTGTAACRSISPPAICSPVDTIPVDAWCTASGRRDGRGGRAGLCRPSHLLPPLPRVRFSCRVSARIVLLACCLGLQCLLWRVLPALFSVPFTGTFSPYPLLPVCLEPWAGG